MKLGNPLKKFSVIYEFWVCCSSKNFSWGSQPKSTDVKECLKICNYLHWSKETVKKNKQLQNINKAVHINGNAIHIYKTKEGINNYNCQLFSFILSFKFTRNVGYLIKEIWKYVSQTFLFNFSGNKIRVTVGNYK